MAMRQIGQLEVGSFEGLLQPVDLIGAFMKQCRAMARPPMLQLRGDPFSVLDGGLAARHRLEIVRVDHLRLERAVLLQHVVDRFPLQARGFHQHLRAAASVQPFSQLLEIGRHRAERLYLGVDQSASR
jgi:hypothetical protein